MKLSELKDLGGIVSAAPVRRDLTWNRLSDDGAKSLSDVFTVHILRPSYGTIERTFSGVDRSRSAALISELVLFGDAPEFERISYEDAFQLQPSLALLFTEAIKEVRQSETPEKS